jgi:Cu/Ag efflux protein CusF
MGTATVTGSGSSPSNATAASNNNSSRSAQAAPAQDARRSTESVRKIDPRSRETSRERETR